MRLRTILIRGVSLACAAALWACPAEPTEQAPASAKTEAKADAPKPPEDQTEAPETEIPVPADFADEAASQITEDNFEAQLDALAAEIDQP